MNWKDHSLLWNQAMIQVMDVRYNKMESKEQLRGYRLPSSAFIYSMYGSAQVWLDGNVNIVSRFHILHGGKGTHLDIEAEEEFAYFLILYKAALPQLCRRELQLLLERVHPFQLQYAFAPQYPIDLLDKAKQMLKEWEHSEALEKLHVKILFYQFVYDLLRQMYRQGIEASKPDLAAQVIRYLNDHYRETISLDSMAELLNYSPQYLSRKFKELTGRSPIDFLIRLRIDKAQELLVTTEATLQEVAASVGYPDLFYFSRMFKKYVGTAPGHYKKSMLIKEKVHDPANEGLKSSIVNRALQRYIDSGNENHYQYREGGEQLMFRKKKLSMAATVLLCAALLLSACGAGNTGNGGTSVPSPSQQSISEQAPAQTPAAAETTRSYTDTQGNVVDIPVHPKRIVMQGNIAGDFWALGIEPVGLDHRFIEGKETLYKQNNPAEDIGFPTNFEKVLSLDPDVIMLGYMMEKQYEEASKIAPVVVFDQAMPLKERLPVIADLIGKKEEAAQWLADYDRQAKAMWQDLLAQGKVKDGETAVVLIYYWDKSMYLMKKGGLADLLYQADGLKMDPAVEALHPLGDSPYISVTEEVMHDQLIGDHLFVLYPSNEDAKATFDELLKTPLWSALPQVKNNKVYFVDTKLNYTDALTSEQLLDELPKLIAQ
ncbi:AraC family transcriptional regulator [Paenibacillus eucommiae]|uniref:AraC family transcriptional regulator n=1 Tax=Paenibacillus eucommiae TaxID=1355755 RepID=UPI0028A58948|nr:AraC family transcriptional regulator [Paenibacillus eucommiae]